MKTSSAVDLREIRRLESADLSDAEAVRRAQQGDRWAQELLFRRYVGLVSATATRLLGNRVQAEDVVQDAFAIALEKLATLRDPASFKSWLMRIAVSRVHRVFRRQRFYRFFERRDEPSPLAQLATRDAGPDVTAELELLDRELRRLPAEDRIAWMLRYVEGMELREVAEACGCSLATTKRRIASARARIRRHVRVGSADE